MSNENLVRTLVEAILKDERFVDLMRSTSGERLIPNDNTLYLIEKPVDAAYIPNGSNQTIFCQQQAAVKAEFVEFDRIEGSAFEQVILVNPSFNLICKLALGIADEPIASFLQRRMASSEGKLRIVSLKNVEDIKNAAFGQHIRKQLNVLQSFGFQIEQGPFSNHPSQAQHAAAAGSLLWSKRALTEKDMLGIEKNGSITVGPKCIVTSLAADMARRRGIKIYREGDTQ